MERLQMRNVREIVHRLRQGETERQIARDLQMSRHTIGKYRELAEEQGYLDKESKLPTDKELLAAMGPAKAPPQTDSTVAPYREVVERLLLEDVEMTAIAARLRENHGYAGSYSSVRRFVHQLRPEKPEASVRVHTGPGEEAQVDFGPVGKLVDPERRLARPSYAFVMTLCFSRHQYAELVFDQKISTWIGCHRRAFESFGGVPRRIVPDNLKAAVLSASLIDPVLGEAYSRMAQHYGFVISPTRPHTPEHKGKVESGVHYLQRNFMAGQEFADIVVANDRLPKWVVEVAGVRRHGTTGVAPLVLFREREKDVLLPLPTEPFALVEILQVKVHADCHVTIDGSFYSVPWTYVGQEVEAHVCERVVEVYKDVELLTTHTRAKQKGEWHTRNEHYPPEKAAYLERTPVRCLEIARRIGPKTLNVVETLLAERPLDRLRSVQGILKLDETVGSSRLEAACHRALYFGDPRFRRIKDILNAALDKEPIPGETESVVVPLRAGSNKDYTYARTAKELFSKAVGEGGE